MIKWTSIVLGIVFLWGGIDNHLNYSAHVNEDLETVDFGGLERLIAGNEKHYISFAGSLDTEHHIYSTHLDYPKYTKFAPWDVKTVRPSTRKLSNYLGATVQIYVPIEGNYLELETMRVNEDNEKTASSVRMMAPLMGTGGRIWALSPPYQGFDKTDQEAWLRKGEFKGVMSELEKINDNYDLRHQLADMRRSYSEGGGQTIPYNAYLIDTYVYELSGEAQKKFEYHVPVNGTEASLYVKTTKDKEAGISRNGVITGVLQPNDSRYYFGFQKVLDLSGLPGKIGIISMESGQQVNEDNFFYTKVGVIGGLLFIGFGVFIGRSSRKDQYS